MLDEDVVVAFFYLLLRDGLPAGEVIRLVRDTTELTCDPESELVYSNEILSELAKQMVDRLKR